MSIKKIACGITASPRHPLYLCDTLRSVQQAGFRPAVFAERADQVLPDGQTLNRVLEVMAPQWVLAESERVWPFPAFINALAAMLDDEHDLHQPADAYLIFQDDVLVTEGLHDWLVRQPIFTDAQIGVVSLFTPTVTTRQRAESGWIDCGDREMLGGQAVLMPTHAAQAFLADVEKARGPAEFDEEGKPVYQGPKLYNLNGTDTQLARWCRETNRKWLTYAPSLIKHLGAQSPTLWEWDKKNKKHERTVEEKAHLLEYRDCEVWCAHVDSLPVPREIIFLGNGLAAVFDNHGKQMGAFQQGGHQTTIALLRECGYDWKTLNVTGQPRPETKRA